MGKHTLGDQPNDDGTAETGAVRKKREERARKPDVMTILSVRETYFTGRPHVFIPRQPMCPRLAPVASGQEI